MSAMNKSLQIEVIKQLLEKHGISPDLKDLEQEIDSTLTLEENIKNISKRYGLKLTKKQIQEFLNKISDEYIEQKNNELIDEYLRMNYGNVDEENIELNSKSKEEFKRMLEDEISIHNEQMSQYFKEVLQYYDPLDFFKDYLFPEIIGDQYDILRKAVLLSLATWRDKKMRTRLHVLIVGPPGTGKTDILLWLKNKIGAFFVNAEYASKVGLAGDARGKEVTPGALAEADGHIICIDELDKMSPKDQSALLQAMEEGRYTIIKGKHRQTFEAEVRVIAACNDIKKIQKPLLDRFDFVIELKLPEDSKKVREKRAKDAEELVDIFFGLKEVPNTTVLNRYLEWIKNYDPKPTDIDRIKAVIRSYIHMTGLNLTEKSYRSLELSILRIAYALAKLHKSDITPETVVKAIELKDPTISAEQIRYLTAIAKGLV